MELKIISLTKAEQNVAMKFAPILSKMYGIEISIEDALGYYAEQKREIEIGEGRTTRSIAPGEYLPVPFHPTENYTPVGDRLLKIYIEDMELAKAKAKRDGFKVIFIITFVLILIYLTLSCEL